VARTRHETNGRIPPGVGDVRGGGLNSADFPPYFARRLEDTKLVGRCGRWSGGQRPDNESWNFKSKSLGPPHVVYGETKNLRSSPHVGGHRTSRLRDDDLGRVSATSDVPSVKGSDEYGMTRKCGRTLRSCGMSRWAVG